MDRTRTVIIVVALLGVMAAVNYFGGEAPWSDGASAESHTHAGDTTAKLRPDDHEGEEPKELIPAIDPLGPANAPVLLEVFYEEENDCHGGIADKASELAIRHTPHVRLKLMPWNAEGTEERANKLDANCLVAVAISTRQEDGSWGPAEVPYTSPPEMDSWTWGELEGLIATKLESEGIRVSAQELLAGGEARDDGVRPPDTADSE